MNYRNIFLLAFFCCQFAIASDTPVLAFKIKPVKVEQTGVFMGLGLGTRPPLDVTNFFITKSSSFSMNGHVQKSFPDKFLYIFQDKKTSTFYLCPKSVYSEACLECPECSSKTGELAKASVK